MSRYSSDSSDINSLWALGVDDDDDSLEAPGDDDELEIDHKV